MRRLSFIILLIAVPIAFAQESSRQRPNVPPFPVGEATSEIRIDGILQEQAWENAAVIPLPYEWTPGDNVPPPVKTDCLVTFDEDNLYIAFRSFDPEPSKIRAHIMDRDSIDTFIQDDHIGRSCNGPCDCHTLPLPPGKPCPTFPDGGIPSFRLL